MHQILCSRNLIMMNLEQEIKYLKEQKAPIEEIRLLEILKKKKSGICCQKRRNRTNENLQYLF